jgi:hypothetical protein
MEYCTKCRSYIVLLFVVFEEEIAYGMGVGALKFVINQRFSQHGLTTARVCRNPEQVVT